MPYMDRDVGARGEHYMRFVIATGFALLSATAAPAQWGQTYTYRPVQQTPPQQVGPSWTAPRGPQYYVAEPRRCFWVDTFDGSRRVCQ